MAIKFNLYSFLCLITLCSNASAEPNVCPDLSNSEKYGADWQADPFPPYPLTDPITQILPHNGFFQARWASLFGGHIECTYENAYGYFTIMTLKPRNNPWLYFPQFWRGTNKLSICNLTEKKPSDCPFK